MLEVVSDAFDLSANLTTLPEKMRVSKTWAQVLFGIIPEERLMDTFKFAFAKHNSSFPVNAYDLKNAWTALEEEEAAVEARRDEKRRENDPVERCTHKNLHRTAKGDIFALNHYSQKDEIMPCPHCRPKDLEKWKKTQIALYGEHKPVPITPSAAVEQILRPKEVFLSREEAEEIRSEYNELVEKLVEDEAARRELLVVFDEGANVFKYPLRNDVLFSPDTMRKKIERYRRALEGRSG